MSLCQPAPEYSRDRTPVNLCMDQRTMMVLGQAGINREILSTLFSVSRRVRFKAIHDAKAAQRKVWHTQPLLLLLITVLPSQEMLKQFPLLIPLRSSRCHNNKQPAGAGRHASSDRSRRASRCFDARRFSYECPDRNR
ncbi:hypothetical protein Pelo_16652 [Pelomyxa schiedti]|nr:hypothetical protein Pelo_16652 [Pelomyxa schiedti]